MTCGKYDQRIQIVSETATSQDTFGADVYTQALIGEYWANVGFLQGRELEQAQQRWAEARYLIKMRRQPGVTLERANRVLWRGLTLDVLDIQGPLTRVDEWAITAKDYVR